MKNRDDSIQCSNCISHIAHYHYYVIESDNDLGVEIDRIATFDIDETLSDFPKLNNFISWVTTDICKMLDDRDYDSILSLKDTRIQEHIESLDWCCMNCGFVVSGVEYNRILFNPVCECGVYRWSDYVIKRYKTKENIK